MKLIELSDGHLVLVDDDDFEYLNQFNWFPKFEKNTNSYYAYRNDGVEPNRNSIYMHREIIGTPKGMICDHINHITLDNRKENLRNVSIGQNNMNRRLNRNSPFGERCIHKNGRYFAVHIKQNGKLVVNKTFKTLNMAIEYRNQELPKYRGEFAYQGESL